MTLQLLGGKLWSVDGQLPSSVCSDKLTFWDWVADARTTWQRQGAVLAHRRRSRCWSALSRCRAPSVRHARRGGSEEVCMAGTS